ncbi:MAG TPA: 3-phosphoshikimate 1-carboxyvinyltransferase [bacterium]|nr:3-phosphoshikimate 1-carboxyvinyltransferase [bacterium]
MIEIRPAQQALDIRVSVPGDKSISHRALIFAALADGDSTLSHLGTGADVRSTARVLQQMGVRIELGDPARVTSAGLDALIASEDPLDVGNSGTTIRLMSGLLSGRPFRSVLTGDESIRQRPMGRIIRPLSQMGARIVSETNETAPLTIQPASLHGIEYHMPVASAQVKSAIILAGLQVTMGETVIHEKSLSRRHTEMMLSKFGAPVLVAGKKITVGKLEQPLAPFNLKVPGDPSSGAYWAAAAAIIPGSRCRIDDVNLSPERIAFYQVLKEMGTEVAIQVRDSTIEPRGDITVKHQPLHGVRLKKDAIPSLIDELPLIAVVGAFGEGSTVIREARELRVKETDRINATVTNLRAMGAEVEEYPDGLTVSSGSTVEGATLDSFGDHRIAMAFGVAALGAESTSSIEDHEVASVSYPEFWDLLQNRVEV